MTNQILIEDLSLVALPAWWENPWLLFTLPVLVGVLFYLMTRWWHSRRAPIQSRPVTEGPPVHDEFLRRLQALRDRRPSIEAYLLGIEVSEILRGYLEAQFRFDIRYQTTREFLTSVASDSRFTSEKREALAGFLQHCDAVKFANQTPSGAEQDGLLDTAEKVIRGNSPPTLKTEGNR